MRHEFGSFDGPGGATIVTQSWSPEAPPRALLLLVHGLAEHCGRYTNVVNRAVPRGFAVHGLDHVGHGRSEGPRTYVRSFSDFTDTLETYRVMLRHEHPQSPLFLVGHSLGALIAAAVLLDHQDAFSGAILSGALVQIPEGISPLLVLLSRLLSRILPKLRLVGVDAAGVSRDSAVVRAYLEDPLVYNGKTTARLGYEILRTIRRVCAEAATIQLPILFLHGEADRLTSVDGACKLHQAVRSADKTLRVYDKLHHEIYNEPEHPQVIEDVLAWIDARLPTQAP